MANAEWRNWAHTVRSRPSAVVSPTSERDIVDAVTDTADRGLTLKCVGAGHSFTPIATTDGVQMSLDRHTGIEAVSPTPTGAEVTVRAGTRLHDLSPILWDLGLAMTNLGDIDQQSLAGATATGTHGTGAGYGGLPTQVTGLRLVTADGSVITCSRQENPEIFEAARLGIGAVGVVSSLTVDCVPAFTLHADERPWTLPAVLADLDGFAESADHAEFYWFPHTDNISVKRNTRLPADMPTRPIGRVRSLVCDEFLPNEVYNGLCRLSARKPTLSRTVAAVSSKALGGRTYSDRSYRVFASPRRVRFREMEYAVPREAAAEALHRLRRLVDEPGIDTPFPVEVRFARADDVWLSTAYGRDVCYIAVHQYWRMDHSEYFRRAEEIFRAAGGRPHWGKMHSLSSEEFAAEIDRFDDFVAVRDSLDPDRVFANEYSRKVLP